MHGSGSYNLDPELVSGLQTAICSWLQTCSCHCSTHSYLQLEPFTPYLSITLLEMVYQPPLYLVISLLVVLPHTRCQTSHQPPTIQSHIDTTGNHSQTASLNRLYRDEIGRDYPYYPEYSHQQYESHRSLTIWWWWAGGKASRRDMEKREMGENMGGKWNRRAWGDTCLVYLGWLSEGCLVAFGTPLEDGDKIRV